MKICFLTDDPSEIGGGPEHIRQISKILRERYHHQVTVISPTAMGQNFNAANFFHRVKFAFWVIRLLFTTDYDLYHSHTFSTSVFLPLVKLRGKITAITLHGLGKTLFGGGLLNYTPIPRFLRWLILDLWPFDLRFSVSAVPGFMSVGNGVDIEEFSKIKRTPHKKFTVLCISRRDPVKGIDILEKAISQFSGVKLNLVSGRRRTMADFANADCYVLPSLSEGLPITVLEAMAARLPIITTDVGDCRRLIESSGSGFIIPPGSVDKLVVAIAQMMATKNRATMGDRGKQYVAKNYTWEKVAAHCNSAYRGLTTGV